MKKSGNIAAILSTTIYSQAYCLKWSYKTNKKLYDIIRKCQSQLSVIIQDLITENHSNAVNCDNAIYGLRVRWIRVYSLLNL